MNGIYIPARCIIFNVLVYPARLQFYWWQPLQSQMRFVRNATVTEVSTAVLDMADLISEEDMVTTDTVIMDTVTTDMVTTDTATEDLISDDEIHFNSSNSDRKMNIYCEYLIKSVIQ